MNILIKFPSRERPKKLLECVRRYISLADDINRIKFLFSFDEDDDTTYSDIFLTELKYLCANIEYYIVFSKSSSKIHAVNRDIEIVDNWDIILLASDDMIPEKKSYDSLILKDMSENFPDTDGILWYSDGFRNDIITLSIMGREYFNRFGYIYHPSYKSFYCDNEFTEVGQLLGKIYKSDQTIIIHEHPDNMKQHYDDLYIKNSMFSNQDLMTYNQRKNNKFKQL
jgi:hypothetical protein